MASEVEIANLALRKLTASDRIDTLEDPTDTARSLSDVWTPTRQRVLSEHPWNVASRRAILAPKATAPAFGFTYAYLMPSDPWCLRVWGLSRDHHGSAVWKVEGRDILTNEGTALYIHFIADVTDVATWPPYLVNVFAEALGESIAYRITGDRQAEAAALGRYRDSLPVARSLDAQESATAYAYADAFENARL